MQWENVVALDSGEPLKWSGASRRYIETDDGDLSSSQYCQRLRRNQLPHIHCRDYRVRLPSDRLALYTGPADRSRPTIEEHQMADNRLSEKFDALSDKAKESANKLKGLRRAREGSTESRRRRSARACHRDRGPVRGEGGRRLRKGLVSVG